MAVSAGPLGEAYYRLCENVGATEKRYRSTSSATGRRRVLPDGPSPFRFLNELSELSLLPVGGPLLASVSTLLVETIIIGYYRYQSRPDR